MFDDVKNVSLVSGSIRGGSPSVSISDAFVLVVITPFGTWRFFS
jgi:hypothetical protein